MKEFLIIFNDKGLRQIASEDIWYVLSDGDYSYIYLINREKFMVVKQLNQIVTMLEEQLPLTGRNFARVGRKHIINLSYLHYIDQSKKRLVLLDRNLNSEELNVLASPESLLEFKKKIIQRNEKQRKNE